MDPAWQERDDALVRNFEFADFAAALAFVQRVGAEAEAAGHHPDVLLHRYRHVRLTLSTHTEGRVTDRDRRLAERIDAVLASGQAPT